MNTNASEYRPRVAPVPNLASSPSNSVSSPSASVSPSPSSSGPKQQPNRNQRNQNQPRSLQRSQTDSNTPRNNNPRPNQSQTSAFRGHHNTPRTRSHSESHDSPTRTRKDSEETDSGLDESTHEGAMNFGKKDKHGRSLNHLLNFTYSERSRGDGPRRLVKKYQPYNKEKYVHATFRFVVKPIDNYQGNLYDPDVLIEWDNIEQVIIPINQELTCPICLSEPVVPRITRCGHVYCLVCIRKYIELGERSWRRCPICFDAVSMNELRCAKLSKMKNYSEGDVIQMRLLKKEKDTSVAYPRNLWSKDVITKPPTTVEVIPTRFSKMSIGSLDYLRDLYKSEIKTLEEQLSEAVAFAEEETIPFIQMAISAEKVQLASIPMDELSKMSTFSIEDTQVDNKVFVVKISDEDNDQNAESAFSDEEKEEEESKNEESKNEETPQEAPKRRVNSLSNEDSYYMYQSDDGQLIFAHPLMIHILIEEFGSPAKLPDIIEAKILELEELSQNEDIRRKYKPFSHLPSSCEFNLCELDLRRIVGRRTYRKYERELRMREEKRRAKVLREEKMSKKSKEKDGVNDLERYLRHFDNYNQSFPKPEESLNPNSFPPVVTSATEPITPSDSTESVPLVQSPQLPNVSYSNAVSNKRPEVSIFSKDDFSTSLKDSKKSIKPIPKTIPQTVVPTQVAWGPGVNKKPTQASPSSSWPSSSTNSISTSPPKKATIDEGEVEDYHYEERTEESPQSVQPYTVNVGKKKKKTVLMSAGAIRKF